MTKLFIVVNEDRFFLSHRKEIALRALKEGYDVTIVCKDTGDRQEVEALGLRMVDMPINPTGMRISEELKTLRFLYRLYHKERPDIVHHVGLKTILWGGLAARWAHTHGVVNAVSGLGVLFSDRKPGLKTRLVMALMKYANHRKGIRAIFQNHEDEDLFIRHGIIKKESAEFIKGSGVDLHDFAYTPPPRDGKVNIIFTARMVKEKGILELVEAAEILRKEMQEKAQFWLCGRLTANQNGISREQLESLCDGDYIQWLGYRTDIKQLLQQSHIMAFPSYYREGLPLSLIEAAAIGRPIVTTQWYGCKDTVDDGVNGFLIPVRDAVALADRLRTLINDPVLREEMGRRSRERAEREFDIQNVVDRHIAIYNSLT
ncbi:MAG: glycosyltransferase family 4 protein [Prevotella sp.]|nr:glycosyltransferase family 4 protein [Prevotella sp.]